MKRNFPYGEIYELSESTQMFINSIVSSGRQVSRMLTSLDEMNKYKNQDDGISILSQAQRDEIYRRKIVLCSQVDDFSFIGRCVAFLSWISTSAGDKNELNSKVKLKRKIASMSGELLYIIEKYPMYRMHPHIEVFIEQLSDKKVYDAICDGDMKDNEASDASIMALISSLRNKKHLMKVHSFNCNAEENYKSYLEYYKELLVDFKRVWVFKLDVYLNDDCFSSVDFDRLTSFKVLFLKDKRKFDFFDNLVGHIWRLEYSPFVGYFYHFVFIFDMQGRTNSEMEIIESRIIKCWNDRVSQQQGHCKKIPITNKDVYVTIGIGEKQSDMEEDTVEIEKVVSYLTKRDGFAKIRHPEKSVNSKKNMRLIGRGKHGKPKNKKYGWIKE
ncbi:inovirus-type Gp2 protein [Aeromonas veronii]|uniref:inovirus-type Gp2 protein n=1 Tax=Aeromonas veronii TaxID=654 RepID=UPI00111A1828|nr:inovirus-type Gp2 protein [Aeromonas veronii]TNI14424.1 hypothetical protein CF106_04130 [Aeromonas veronii]